MSSLAATAAEAITVTVFCTGSLTFRPPFTVLTVTVPNGICLATTAMSTASGF